MRAEWSNKGVRNVTLVIKNTIKNRRFTEWGSSSGPSSSPRVHRQLLAWI